MDHLSDVPTTDAEDDQTDRAQWPAGQDKYQRMILGFTPPMALETKWRGSRLINLQKLDPPRDGYLLRVPGWDHDIIRDPLSVLHGQRFKNRVHRLKKQLPDLDGYVTDTEEFGTLVDKTWEEEMVARRKMLRALMNGEATPNSKAAPYYIFTHNKNLIGEAAWTEQTGSTCKKARR